MVRCGETGLSRRVFLAKNSSRWMRCSEAGMARIVAMPAEVGIASLWGGGGRKWEMCVSQMLIMADSRGWPRP